MGTAVLFANISLQFSGVEDPPKPIENQAGPPLFLLGIAFSIFRVCEQHLGVANEAEFNCPVCLKVLRSPIELVTSRVNNS